MQIGRKSVSKGRDMEQVYERAVQQLVAATGLYELEDIVDTVTNATVKTIELRLLRDEAEVTRGMLQR